MGESSEPKTSRYAIELFVEPPEEEFICSICQDVLDGPLELPCRHMYCQICIKEVNKRSDKQLNCPLCRQDYKEKDLRPPSFALQGLLRKLKMRCQNKECGKVVTLEDYCNHNTHCEFAPVVCPIKNCPKKVYQKDLERHKEGCKYREIPCPLGCGSTHQLRNMEDHFLLNCNLAFADCPFANCSQQVCKKDLDRHKEVCEFREVPCPHGCGEIIQHKDVEEHHNTSCPKGIRICEKCERTYRYEERDDHDCIRVLKEEVLLLKVQAKRKEMNDKKEPETGISKQVGTTPPSPMKTVSLKVSFKTFFKATTAGDKVKADTRDILCLPGGLILVSDGKNCCLKLFDHDGKLINKTTFKEGWCRLADIGEGRVVLLNTTTRQLAFLNVPSWSPANESLFDVEKNYYRITALNPHTLAAVGNNTKGIDILSLDGKVIRSIGTSEEIRRCHASQDGSLLCTYPKGILKINTSTTVDSEITKTPLPKVDNLVGLVELPDTSLILCDYAKKALHHLDSNGKLVKKVWTLPRRDSSDGLCYISACDGVIACCSDQRVYVFELVKAK